MKTRFTIILMFLLSVFATVIISSSFRAANEEPWTEKQLMEPSKLARTMENSKAKQPLVICVGPGALIKGSTDIGPARDQQNLEKLKERVKDLPKNTEIVIYCGCCPFDRCPNIRPAFTLLNDMKFRNHHLLDLKHNLRTDWIEKGYPTTK